jgi:hypothetical protein
MIVSMMFGWLYFGIRIPPSELPSELRGVFPVEISYTMSLFELTSYVNLLNDMVQTVATGMGLYGDLMGFPGNMGMDQQLMEVLTAFQTATVVLTIVVILLILAMLLLLIFIFLAVLNNKRCAIFGQLGAILALFMSAVFAIVMAIVGSMMPPEVTYMLSMSSSVWVYLTIAFSLAVMIIVSARRRVFKGV